MRSRNIHSTAAMTVLLEHSLSSNARNSYFVSVLIAYLLISLFIPVQIFQIAFMITVR